MWNPGILKWTRVSGEERSSGDTIVYDSEVRSPHWLVYNGLIEKVRLSVALRAMDMGGLARMLENAEGRSP